MFDVTYCNAPQDEPLRGFEKCFHHGDTLEMQHFLCALVYIPPKHSIAKQAFFHWKEFYKSSIGLLSKPKFTIVVQSSYKVGEMVCSRILIQHVWAQNSLKLRSSIVQSMDFKDWGFWHIWHSKAVREPIHKNLFCCRMLRVFQILKSRPLACFLLLLTTSLFISLSSPRGEIIITVW